ncbi:dodecin domain-containing protein [Chloroflexota bacterium]
MQVLGISEDSWEHVAKNALKGAQKTIHSISSIELVS